VELHKELADDNQDSHPMAAQEIQHDFCVQDPLSGASTLEKATDIQHDESTLRQTAGYTLRK
jgi:hypothetical protein